MNPSESVVLCEGYHDRAFWAGWLKRLGCTSCKGKMEPSDRVAVRGQYSYHSPSEQFVRVVPCNGKNNLPIEASSRLKDVCVDRPLTHLVLCVDSDLSEDAAEDEVPTLGPQAVENLLEKFDTPVVVEAERKFTLFSGATTIHVVRWSTNGVAMPGVPPQQTLERLVCAAVVAAYPERGPAVQRWLDSRPEPPKPSPKEFGWSYMAGWYAELGCEAFLQKIWNDKEIVRQLESRLQAIGAWAVAEALVS